MLLDDIQNFIDEYHLIGWGIGGLAGAAMITLFFKTVVGRWKWQKDKTLSSKPKQSIDQYRMEQAEE